MQDRLKGKIKMKKGAVIPITLTVVFLISMLVGSFMLYYAKITSREFHIDLAELRGYWAVYGAKELNVTNVNYNYSTLFSDNQLYRINITKNANSYNWNIINLGSGIKDTDLFKRELNVTNSGNIISYRHN